MLLSESARRVAIRIANTISNIESDITSLANHGMFSSKERLIDELRKYKSKFTDRPHINRILMRKEEYRNIDGLIYFIANGHNVNYDEARDFFYTSWYKEEVDEHIFSTRGTEEGGSVSLR